MLTPPCGPTPDSSMRLIAMGVASDLASGACGLGSRSLFRTVKGWHSHGFAGDSGSGRLRELCANILGPSDPEAGESFARGMRSVFSIVLEGEPVGTTDDVDDFWRVVARLGEVMEVDVPSAPIRPSGPMIRGH